MIDLLVNSRYRGLSAYSGETETYSTRLNLNENPFDIAAMLRNEIQEEISSILINRYPDASGKELKKYISEYTGVSQSQIAIGNGSDELIYLLLHLFLDKGDKVLIHTPTFSMYSQYAAIIGAQTAEYKTNEEFDIDVYAFREAIELEKPKVIFICNPNNPTGRALDVQQIEFLIKGFEGIAIIDEAYYEFYGQSAAKLLTDYPNVIILRTFSKAMASAGLRIGYFLSNETVKDYFDKIRSPYNVNVYSQAVAKVILRNLDIVKKVVAIIQQERKRLNAALRRLEGIKVFDSKANFILVKSDRSSEIYNEMLNNGVKVRSFNEEPLRDCLRITIGTERENSKMLKVLGGICYGR